MVHKMFYLSLEVTGKLHHAQNFKLSNNQPSHAVLQPTFLEIMHHIKTEKNTVCVESCDF